MGKVIGILGGMGPRSTTPFIEKVLDECQRQYGAKYDDEYPEMMVYSLPTPFYMDKPVDDEALRLSILEGVKKLSGTFIDFLVIPCNIAHLYFDTISHVSSVPVINMIEITSKLLTPGKTTLFATEMTARSGIYPYDILFDDWQSRINHLIADIKEGKKECVLNKQWRSLLDEVKKEDVKNIIIGCTDLSIFSDAESEMVILDSSMVLAQETVKEWLR